MRREEGYPSDLKEEEWKIIRRMLPDGNKLGRPAQYGKREILNAIFYVARAGCAWRMLPTNFPPWRIVYYYFFTWTRRGVWQKIHQTLVERKREMEFKKKDRLPRYSTARVLKRLTNEEFAATMRERRFLEESVICWWIAMD